MATILSGGDELNEIRETHKCNCVLHIVWRQGCDAAVPWDLYVIYMAKAHKAFIVLPQTSSNTDTLHYDVIIGTMASQITSLMINLLKENIKPPRHWLWAGKSPGTGEFPAQMASYAENVSIWWRHHATTLKGRDISHNVTGNVYQWWMVMCRHTFGIININRKMAKSCSTIQSALIWR